MPGVACPASPHWVNVPFARQGGEQTTASTKATSAIDGQDGTSISCTVRATANGFDVNATLKAPAVDPSTNQPVNPTRVTLSTSIAAGQTAPGSVGIQDNATATGFTSTNDTGQSDSTCTFSVKPAGPGDQLGITAGRIWASVSCPKFRDPASSNLNEVCAIGTGHVVLENCAR
jgi:hypothetical protein